ncbi:DUF4062 domain-containing protein [Pseudomonas sp. TMW22090]|uniref:DUF4062 domain-containing protein n=1 Tax=Pseudomonas sp. TMW22090 TaxID=2506434 RepID=UPI001F111472|nr:DUF4062 domain-containing protein [Pseudomonas sp. TMW22090]MCH4878891.1 DUF4062 domain-containing protein [Pseudomonas sp. TMW22090]
MPKRPIILVSSTVYGIEDLLNRIYMELTTFGYEVWMSHRGTLPVWSDQTAFENCLAAVDACDLFLGLITPEYGSGRDGTALSITHQELQRAIACKKPRWLLAHQNVVFARRFLRDLGYKTAAERAKLNLKSAARSIGDLRVIDMYEEAILDTRPMGERHGNWVQEFGSDEEALLFASAQFARVQEVERFLNENFSNAAAVVAAAQTPRGGQS